MGKVEPEIHKTNLVCPRTGSDPWIPGSFLKVNLSILWIANSLLKRKFTNSGLHSTKKPTDGLVPAGFGPRIPG